MRNCKRWREIKGCELWNIERKFLYECCLSIVGILIRNSSRVYKMIVGFVLWVGEGKNGKGRIFWFYFF